MVLENFKERLTRFPIILRPLIVVIVLLNFLLVIAWWVISKYYTYFNNMYSSKKWPTTEGTIDTSYVHHRKTLDGVNYKPIIIYSYSVNGTRHHSDQIAFSLNILPDTGYNSFRRLANRKIRRYPVNKRVTVYYNPSNHEQAVLEPGIKWIRGIIYLVLSYFLLTPLIGFQILIWVILLDMTGLIHTPTVEHPTQLPLKSYHLHLASCFSFNIFWVQSAFEDINAFQFAFQKLFWRTSFSLNIPVLQQNMKELNVQPSHLDHHQPGPSTFLHSVRKPFH